MSTIVKDFLTPANFEQAWYKVRDNKGCAGIDEETIEEFALNLKANLAGLRNAVTQNTYQVKPLKQALIPKGGGKLRELRIPSIRDRIVQQALLNVLVPIIEPTFSDSSFAYRPNRSIIKAVERVAEWRDRRYVWILDADIVKFFDNIDRQILLTQIRRYIDHPGILCLLKAWIASDIVTNQGIKKTDRGIPQGAVISPLLANIYLNKFDKDISQNNVQLVRYADDFLLLAKSRNEILQAYTEVVKLLHSLNLAIHPEKTQITNFERGFRFLGHGFMNNNIFPLESPREKAKAAKKKFFARKKKRLKRRRKLDIKNRQRK